MIRTTLRASCLLAALVAHSPADSLWLCVVDPGVGTERKPLVARADGRWLVGPDNGLLALACRRAASCTIREITWRPDSLSTSFHGRDLFAPVAAALASGSPVERAPVALPSLQGHDWPDLRPEVVYIDGSALFKAPIRGESKCNSCGRCNFLDDGFYNVAGDTPLYS